MQSTELNALAHKKSEKGKKKKKDCEEGQWMLVPGSLIAELNYF